MINWTDFKDEERYMKLVSSINYEPRNITLLKIINRNPKTFKEMENLFSQMFLEDSVMLNKKSFKSYVDFFFAPNGFAKKVNDNANSYSEKWILTDSGVDIAKPSAAHALYICNKYKFSLHDVLGRSNGRGELTAPYNTSRIIEYLEKKKDSRIKDIARNLKVNNFVVSQNLTRLKGLGFAEFDSYNHERRISRNFSWNKGSIEDLLPVQREVSITRYVAEEIRSSNGYISVDEITRNVNEKYGKTYSVFRVGTIANGIENQKLIKSDSKIKRSQKQSNVNLTEKGHNFYKDFVLPIKFTALSNTLHPEVSMSLKRYNDPATSLSDLVNALGLYAQTAPHRNLNDNAKTDSEVKNLLNKGKMRPRDIEEYMGRNVDRSLKRLLNNGEIVSERNGGAIYYTLRI